MAWAEGHFPTPHGNIHVAWRRQNQQFDLTVDVPVTSSFQVRLPILASHVYVNGQAAWAAGEATQAISGLSVSELVSGHLALQFEQGGSASIQATSAA